MTFPEIPLNYKLTAIYEDIGPTQYHTAIGMTEDKVAFFVWDGVSEQVNQIFTFRRVPLEEHPPT